MRVKALLVALALLLAVGVPLSSGAASNLDASQVATPVTEKGQVTIVFHPAYLTVYSDEPDAEPGRIESILNEVQGVPGFVFAQPVAASEDDLRAVHTQQLIDDVKFNTQLYDIACLSAGGAILASQLAAGGGVSMAINRPPGHHASADTNWGYCYFNNIAVAVTKLLNERKIQRALIVDFDLHFGNGTNDIFANNPRVTYFHVDNTTRYDAIHALENFLAETKGYDILAVSAGFDGGKEDWGRVFEIQDYTTIGTLLRKAAEKNCGGRRFAVLEGGYNIEVLGKNVKAFLDGFRG
jgi:acetoin utilization deacetylase AcuC-like enzyme